MTARRSIEIAGFVHGDQPIPAAAKVGPLVVTGGIYGIDRQTGEIPVGIDDQARLMFENLVAIMAEAGGGPEAIARMNVYVRDRSSRDAVNHEWLKLFPDAASRPARHTLVNPELPTPMLVQCDAIAWIP